MYEKKRRETEKRIEDSLLQLMKEQTFETISIRQLIDLAEVNRSTFYRHYLDKYDLLEKIENRLLDDLQAYYQEALDSACLFKLEKEFKVEDFIHDKQNLFHFFEPYLEDLAILLGPKWSISSTSPCPLRNSTSVAIVTTMSSTLRMCSLASFSPTPAKV